MYTIERMNEWMKFSKPANVNDLILEGAKEYYANVRHNQNDYVTKAEISRGLDDAFDQFLEQPKPEMFIEYFAKLDDIEVEAVHFAINQRKVEFIEHLRARISGIAKAANKELED